MIHAPSPNFNDRKDGKQPRFLVLHYTDTKTAAEAVDMLKDPARQVSAHYVLDEDGTVIHMVPEDKRAWHAGKSYWLGETDINSASIGIEIQNPGHSYGYRAFPPAQIAALIPLCRGIMARHGIAPSDVIGHSDIAITRKIDPDYLFPWQELAAQGMGFWPGDKNAPVAAQDIPALLNKIGYDPGMPEQERLTAFQRHFVPEVFVRNDGIGVPTPLTLVRLGGFL